MKVRTATTAEIAAAPSKIKVSVSKPSAKTRTRPAPVNITTAKICRNSENRRRRVSSTTAPYRGLAYDVMSFRSNRSTARPTRSAKAIRL